MKYVSVFSKGVCLFSLAFLFSTKSIYGNQEFAVSILLSDSKSAPTVEQLVNDYDSFNPSLSFLKTYPVSDVIPLLRFRANSEFKQFLETNPEHPRARLERTAVLIYDQYSASTIISAAISDNNVLFANEFTDVKVASDIASGQPSSGTTWNMQALNVDSARLVTRGHGWVGVTDIGIEENRFDFEVFNKFGSFLNGSFLKHLARDFTRLQDPSGLPCNLVDERAGWAQITGSLYGHCYDDVNNRPSHVGHGTHVSGILAANHFSTYPGVCPGCSQIVGKWRSVGAGSARQTAAVFESITRAIDIGAGVSNLSFTFPTFIGLSPDVCDNPPNVIEVHDFCTLVEYAAFMDHIVVAAAGNDRIHLAFPSADERVIAVGGIDDNGIFWDESPGNNLNCPYFNMPPHDPDQECGSNYSHPGTSGQVDVVAPAKDVPSTLYDGFDWNPIIGCVESSQGSGVGLCTGTSMAAPHVSGMIGLIRSVNPLLRDGTRDPYPGDSYLLGVRNVLNQTSSNSATHDAYMGYGIPDARAALEMVLGKSDGQQLLSRATPLFVQLSDEPGDDGSDADDFHYTASPLIAQSYLYNHIFPMHYYSVGEEVDGYTAWPGYPVPPGPSIEPRAEIYVLTTEQNPFGNEDLIPLHRMVYRGESDDNSSSNNRDMVYAISDAEVELLNALDVDTGGGNKYEYEGIEGYIFPLCDGIPGCQQPPGTVKVLRRYHKTRHDHAIFPETKLGQMAGEGYECNSIFADNQCSNDQLTGELGYAFLNVNSDADNLADGVEYMIGTDPNLEDSDCDGLLDHEEYPLDFVQDQSRDPLDGTCLPETDISISHSYVENNTVETTVSNIGSNDAEEVIFSIEYSNMYQTGGIIQMDANPLCVQEPPWVSCTQQNCVIVFNCSIDDLQTNQSITITHGVCENAPDPLNVAAEIDDHIGYEDTNALNDSESDSYIDDPFTTLICDPPP